VGLMSQLVVPPASLNINPEAYSDVFIRRPYQIPMGMNRGQYPALMIWRNPSSFFMNKKKLEKREKKCLDDRIQLDCINWILKQGDICKTIRKCRHCNEERNVTFFVKRKEPILFYKSKIYFEITKTSCNNHECIMKMKSDSEVIGEIFPINFSYLINFNKADMEQAVSIIFCWAYGIGRSTKVTPEKAQAFFLNNTGV